MNKRINFRWLLIFVLSAILCLTVGIVGCQPDNGETGGQGGGGGESTTSISEMLKGKNGQEYTVQGVVYGVTSNGYFISDGEGQIFVQDATSVQVGTQLTVKATLNVSGINMLALQNATVTVGSSGNAALQPTASTIAELTGMTVGRTAYYQYVTISGTVTENNGKYTLVNGTDYVILDSRTNLSLFQSWVNAKVDISVIVSGYSQAWEVLFLGGQSDIARHPIEVDDIKDAVFADVQSRLPASVYFKLDLPASYALEPGLEFNWSVVSGGEAVSVAQNVATVTEPSANTEVTLKLEISSEGQSASQTFTVRVLAAQDVALDNLSSTGLGVIIKVEGTVLTKAHFYSSSGERDSILIADEQGNLATVDVAETSIGSIQRGDKIKLAGTYASTMGGYVSAVDFIVKQSDPNYTVDWAQQQPAIELKTDEDYQTLISDRAQYHNKLVKITAPYIIYSGTTSYNFIRFSSDPAQTLSTSGRYLAFSVVSFDQNAPGLRESMDIPFQSSSSPRLYEEYSIYAYAMYVVDAATPQLVLPGADAVIVDKSIVAEKEIVEAFGTTMFNAEADGKIDLPASTKTAGNITWTSSDNDLIDETGAYKAVQVETKVTLTAHYKIDGQDCTCEIVVTLMAKAAEYLTVTQALALEDGVIPFMKGTIVAFGPNTGTGIPGGAQMGVYISDGKNVMYIADGQFARSEDEQNYDKVYTLEDGHRLTGGDELYFVQAVKTGATLQLGVKTTLNASNVQVQWAPEAEVTEITSFAGMKAFFANGDNLGKMIKFVGTVDNPLYLGGSSSTYDSLNLKFYHGDVEGEVTSANVKVDSDHTVAAKARSSEFALGLAWWHKLNPAIGTDSNPAWVGTNEDYGFTGEIYAIWRATTSSYHQLALLSGGFTLKALTDEDLAVRELEAAVPQTVSAAQAGTVILPTQTAHAKDVTWTSNSELFNAQTGEYQAVTQSTEVILTAHYTVGQAQKTHQIHITLENSAKVSLTVTQAIAQGGEIAELKDAVVVGIAPAHSGSGYPVAFYLSDGVSVITLVTASGAIAINGSAEKVTVTLNGTELKVGDKITLTNVTVTGNTLACTQSTTGTLAQDAVEVGGNWFKPQTEGMTVIDSNEDLAAWMSGIKALGTTKYNGEANKYEVVKVVATAENPIYIGARAKYFLTMYYLDDAKKESTDKNDSGYNAGNSDNTLSWFGTHSTALAYNMGAQWVLDNTPMTALGVYDDYKFSSTPGASSPADTYAFSGEFYFIFEYAGSASYPYMYVGVLGCGMNLTRITAE